MMLDLSTWIAVVEVPVLLALVGWIYKIRKDLEDKLDRRETQRREDQAAQAAARDAVKDQLWQAVHRVDERLDTYKLEVADKYASVAHLKDVEERIVKGLDKLAKDLAHVATAINRMQGAHEARGAGE